MEKCDSRQNNTKTCRQKASIHADTAGKNTNEEKPVQQKENSVLNVTSGIILQRFASPNPSHCVSKNKTKDGYADVIFEFFIDTITNENTSTASKHALTSWKRAGLTSCFNSFNILEESWLCTQS